MGEVVAGTSMPGTPQPQSHSSPGISLDNHSCRQTTSRATLGRVQPTHFSLEAAIPTPTLRSLTGLVRLGSRPCLLWQMGACPGPGMRDVPQQDPLHVRPSPHHPWAGRMPDSGTICCRAESVGACPLWWILHRVPELSTGSLQALSLCWGCSERAYHWCQL